MFEHAVRDIRYEGGAYTVDDRFRAPFLVGAGGTSCPVYRALFLLSSRGIKHLPMVEAGRLAGIVTLRQLLKLRYPEPMTLIAGIAGARFPEDLAAEVAEGRHQEQPPRAGPRWPGRAATRSGRWPAPGPDGSGP